MHITCSYKRLRIRRLKIAVAAVVISLFLIPGYSRVVSEGDNYFTIYVNGENVGAIDSVEKAKEYLLEARKALSAQSDQLTFLETNLTFEGQEVVIGKIDSKASILDNMSKVLSKSINSSLVKAYEVKVNDYTVILKSPEEVKTLLQAAIDKYDTSDSYVADLQLDANRELPVFSAILNTDKAFEAIDKAKEEAVLTAGIDAYMAILPEEIEVPQNIAKLEDYETGITDISFKDKVEVVEVYVNPDQIASVDLAISDVTEEELQNDIYTVVAGDSLIAVAIKTDIPLDDILAMNPSLEDENTILHIGDEIVITVAKPKLTVIHKEIKYIEENYSEDTIIHWDPDKYTSDVTVLRQPSDGHRNVVAEVTFENGEQVSREIIDQEVTLPAIAKEIEKGEKIPPTYIKPISGGRLTSTFGKRTSPTKGASTYHKGIDWGVAQGTPVYASCGGTVIKAGWGSGYGYCVYIQHPDGKQTRYGHLSKVLVSAGQKVSQGQRIALSGNTGVSTGPHLHFEILVNGTKVNPFNYLS